MISLSPTNMEIVCRVAERGVVRCAAAHWPAARPHQHHVRELGWHAPPTWECGRYLQEEYRRETALPRLAD